MGFSDIGWGGVIGGGLGFPLLGGLAGGKKSGKFDPLNPLDPFGKKQSTTTGTTQVEPWGPQQPYLQGGFRRAEALSHIPLEYYGGPQVAGFTPEQTQAQELATGRALAGSPLLRGAQTKAGQISTGSMLGRTPDLQYIEDTLSGKYLTPESNPYLDYYTERAFEETLPQWDTTATEAGRFGSDVWALGKGRTMADIQSSIYGGAYETERDRQATMEQYATGLGEAAYQSEADRMMQAIGMAPQLAREDYFDMAQLASVGAEKQALKQAEIDAAKQKFEFEQMEPWQRVGNYMNIVTGDLGGTTTAESLKKGK